MSNLNARLDGNLPQQGDLLKAKLFDDFIYTLAAQREDERE